MVAIVYTASYIFCLQQNELQHAIVSLNMFENVSLKLACETVKLSCSFHLSEGMHSTCTCICKHQRDFIFCIYVNPIALRKAKIVCNFGLSESNRVQALRKAKIVCNFGLSECSRVQALRKTKIVCNFGLSECNRVQQYFCMLHLRSFSYQ